MEMARRRALVTGANRGLGAHLVRQLAARDWQVSGIVRRPTADVEPIDGVAYVQADLSDLSQVEALPDRLEEPCDLVIHSAVWYPDPRGPAPTTAAIESAFRVNALAPYTLTRALLDRWDAEHQCTVVMVNSEAIYHADGQSGLYAATKAALRVLSTTLAHAVRERPVAVATLLLGPLGDERKMADIERVAAQRDMSPDEVTKVFLRRSNPDLVIDRFIDFEDCWRSVAYIVDLGHAANGMMCRLDGGSAGSLL